MLKQFPGTKPEYFYLDEELLPLDHALLEEFLEGGPDDMLVVVVVGAVNQPAKIPCLLVDLTGSFLQGVIYL